MNISNLIGETIVGADQESGYVITYNNSLTFNLYRMDGIDLEPLDCRTWSKEVSISRAKEIAEDWLTGLGI